MPRQIQYTPPFATHPAPPHADVIHRLCSGLEQEAKLIFFTSLFDKCCAVFESTEPVKPDEPVSCILKEMRYYIFQLLNFFTFFISENVTESALSMF